MANQYSKMLHRILYIDDTHNNLVNTNISIVTSVRMGGDKVKVSIKDNLKDRRFNVYVLLMLIANFVDYYSTMIAMDRGFIELNPLMNVAIEHGKIGIIKLIVPILVIVYIITRVSTVESMIRARRVILIGFIIFTLAFTNNIIHLVIAG